jgi:hypothetical protein
VLLWNGKTALAIADGFVSRIGGRTSRLLATIYVVNASGNRMSSGSSAARPGYDPCWDTVRTLTEAAARQRCGISELKPEYVVDTPRDTSCAPALQGAAVLVFDPNDQCCVGAVGIIGLTETRAETLLREFIDRQGYRTNTQ